MSRTNRVCQWIEKIAEAGLSGDCRRLELAITQAAKSIRSESPEVTLALRKLLASHASNPGSLRWANASPPPSDRDEGLSLVQIDRDPDACMPILTDQVWGQVERFVTERQGASRLLENGYTPPTSFLLKGKPGTGKTMLAKWLASALDLPLVTFDLATSISSLLGKTGLNIRQVLDYARSQPCLLLIDEFDAVAKRRDDASEVGELNRIVNVLLKELESWPIHSVLVAATNHEELLDPAIPRRFDVVLEVPLPGPPERERILRNACAQFVNQIEDWRFLCFAGLTDGFSGSTLNSLVHQSVREHLLTDRNLSQCLTKTVRSAAPGIVDGRSIGPLIRRIHDQAKSSVTVRDLALLFEKSPSTIHHHLKKVTKNG